MIVATERESIVDVAREFVDDCVLPRADDWDRAGAIPEDVLRRVSAAGLWAPFLSVAVGGLGLDMVGLGALHEEIGHGCSSLRSLLTVHTMVSWAVQRFGDDTQRERWLPGLAAGHTLGAFCLSEPGAGSDTAAITTTAVANGGGYRLTGVKTWITNGRRADLFLVFARVGAATVAFLVPRELPGVAVRPIDDMLGTRAAMLAEITFDDVALGRDAVLGPIGFASGMVLTGVLDLGRFSVASGSIGIIRSCLEACVAYTTERTVGGDLLRDLPLVQAKVSDMVTDLNAGRLLVAEAARLKDDGDPATLMATWVAKYFASTAAARHAAEAVQIHGANGCSPRYPVARYYRDAKVMEIIEGSTEVQRTTIAAAAYRGSHR